MTKIRNISQTAMERDIVKTAPDMVVYINDLPIVFNPYIGDSGVSVNFNDFITNISGTADCDALIPSANITMSVPNHYNYLFLVPGGNKILSTMSTIKMFSKGYYFDENGDSIYHRVFYGVIDSIGYTYTGTTLQITINCKGIMRLFELIQTNVNPSTMNFGVMKTGTQLTAFRTKDYDKSALAIIYKNIFRDLVPEEIAAALNETTVQRAGSSVKTLDTRIKNEDLVEMIQTRFINRWSPVLSEIKKATRIFGFDYEIENKLKTKTELKDLVEQQKYIESTFKNQVDSVAKYLPDYAIGNITLLQSRITSKLERISSMASVTGYEAYQDLNGNIIFKPPLYNLDVTQSKLEESKNPFIINLDEVIDETEQEDEQGIRVTRVTVKGQPWGALLQDYPGDILPGVATYTDMNLFSKFGMREEPVREITWLKQDDAVNYAYAISEMYRMNRAYRTYRFSIPMRPEMKLGFPCYIKHHDMYGYIRNISWSYSVGGTSTMSITLDCIRRRILMPFQVKRDDDTKITEYKSIPNLVLKFSKNPNKEKAKKSAQESEINPSGTKNSVGAVSSVKDKDQKEHSKREIHDDYIDFITVQTKIPEKGQVWLIGEDEKKFFTEARPCDTKYMVELNDRQPFTDHNGYELYGPFPWGRWQTLEDAISAFTLSLTEQRNNNQATSLNIDSLALGQMFLANVNPDVNKLTGDLENNYDKQQEALSSNNVTTFILSSSAYATTEQLEGPNKLNAEGTQSQPRTDYFIKPNIK